MVSVCAFIYLVCELLSTYYGLLHSANDWYLNKLQLNHTLCNGIYGNLEKYNMLV